jgi:inorganic pyrophosphatase
MKLKYASLKYDRISPKLDGGGRETTVRAVVETPRGSRHKFALDPNIGAFVLKQTLASGLAWPYEYGFIPQTRGADGDPLDIIVLMDEPTFSGCVLTVRLLGYIGLRQNGIENNRFVACLLPSDETSLSTDYYKSIKDLPDKLLKEIQDFLKEYSEERGDEIELTGCEGIRKAVSLIEAGERAFADSGDE